MLAIHIYENFFIFWLLFWSIGLGAQTALRADDAAGSPRTVASFDRSWKFHLGDAAGAEQADFDDSSWRGLDIPHDFMIEGVPNPDPAKAAKMEGPFDPPAGRAQAAVI